MYVKPDSAVGAAIAKPMAGVVLGCVAALLLSGNARSADWRQEMGTFRVGMIAAAAPSTAGLAALRRSYSAALGMPVDFFIARDFAMLIDAQASSRVEYAIYSATAYATASELCQCVEPLSAPLDVDGALGLRSIVIARRDLVSALSDLPKAGLLVPPDDSIPGWQAPLALLAEDGLPLRGDEPFVIKAESAAAAEQKFIAGESGAIIGWERVTDADEGLPAGGTLDRLKRAGVDPSALEIIWRSPVLRYGPHTVRKALSSEAKVILTDYLAEVHSKDPQAYDLLSGGHAGGFAPVDDLAYAPVKELVRAAAKR